MEWEITVSRSIPSLNLAIIVQDTAILTHGPISGQE